MKPILLSVVFTVFVIVLSSCAPKQTPTENERIVIAVTIPPLKYFVNEIIKDSSLFDVFSILPEGHDYHTFSVQPATVSMLNNADIIITMGVEYEDILMPYVKEHNPDIVVIDASKGLDFIVDRGHKCCPHPHKETHTNKQKDQDADKLYRDPHVWLSIKNGSVIAKNIGYALSKYYEQDTVIAGNIKKNSTILEAKLDSVYKHYAYELKSLQGAGFFIYHPSLAYFARDFGLKQHAVETDGRSPTPSELLSIVNKASQENILVFFHQKEYANSAVDNLLSHTNLEKVLFRPLNPEWFDTMSLLAETIVQAYSL